MVLTGLVTSPNRETCGTCDYYLATPGECHRDPGRAEYVKLYDDKRPELLTFWPRMLTTDTCGEWQEIDDGPL